MNDREIAGRWVARPYTWNMLPQAVVVCINSNPGGSRSHATIPLLYTMALRVIVTVSMWEGGFRPTDVPLPRLFNLCTIAKRTPR